MTRLLKSPWIEIYLAVFGLMYFYPHPSQDIHPADAGEFQLVAKYLGIAHPPGYALYTMAAHALGRLDFATFSKEALALQPASCCFDLWAWSVNGFSNLLAFFTLTLVYGTARRLTGMRAAGVLAVVALALSPTFMAQSTVANIRMPSALFTAALFYLAVSHNEHLGNKNLFRTAFVFGLAVGHHPSLVFLGPPIALLFAFSARQPRLWRDPRWPRLLAEAVGAFALGLLPILYLPVRDAAHAYLAPGGLNTPGGLLAHITGYGFRGDLGLGERWHFWDRALVLANILWLQFGRGLVAVAAGAAWLIWRRRSAGLALVASAAVFCLLGILYRAPQTMEYLLPAYVALAICLGAAAGAIGEAVAWRLALAAAASGQPPQASAQPDQPPTQPKIVAGVTLLLAAIIVFQGRALPAAVQAVNRAQASVALRSVMEDCVSPPAKAPANRPPTQVLANWHFVTPLRFLDARDNGRAPEQGPIHYVNPEGAEPIGETWRRRAMALGAPAVLTNRTHEMEAAGLALWPLPFTPFFMTTPDACMNIVHVEETTQDEFNSQIRLTHATPRISNDGITLVTGWMAIRPVTETLTIVGQLVNPADGQVWAQADHGFPATRWNDPRGVADQMDLPPFRGTLPHWLSVQVGLYRNTPIGPERLKASLGGPTDSLEAISAGTADSIGLFEINTRPTSIDRWPPTTQPEQVPFGNAMTLLASSVERQDGGRSVQVDLTWLAERAYASDYTVSVQLHGEGWSALDDGTPAQGMIPTLKWLPGMVIHDRHRIALPADVAAGAPFKVTVGVYDAFSLEPLPVTDAARVRAGEGQAVTIGEY